jgi:hypothetical protein
MKKITNTMVIGIEASERAPGISWLSTIESISYKGLFLYRYFITVIDKHIVIVIDSNRDQKLLIFILQETK